MKIKGLFIILFIVFSLTQASQSVAQVKLVQAGVMHYFTRYIEWPSTKQQGDFIICVLGNDEITTHLKGMASTKKVGIRNIQVKEISDLGQAKGSHILVLTNSKIGLFNSALQMAKVNNILLITDKSGYAARGAGINFVVKNNNPSYEINAATMSACGLKFSSKLSALGSVIQ